MPINQEPQKIDLGTDALTGTEVGSNGLLKPEKPIEYVPNGHLADPTKVSIESNPLQQLPEEKPKA